MNIQGEYWIYKRYPEDLRWVREQFKEQRNENTCGPVAVRHGLLLGGLYLSEAALSAHFQTQDEDGTDGPTIQKALKSLGFEVTLEGKKRRETTDNFLKRMDCYLREGAFLLACIYNGEHWVCLGALKRERIWGVDSFGVGWSPELNFTAWTADDFDGQEWGDEVLLVKPDKHKDYFKSWLPARQILLHMPLDVSSRSGTFLNQLNEACVFLNDEEYSYSELNLYLKKGVQLSLDMEAPDAGSVAVEYFRSGKIETDTVAIRCLKGDAPGTAASVPIIITRGDQLVGFQLN